MAFCVVLFGAVLMATGCGLKPEKGAVLKVTKTTMNEKSEEPKDPMYYCFHTDGFFYQAVKKDGKLHSEVAGPYTNDSKTKKLTVMEQGTGIVYDYTTSGDNMTLKVTMSGGPMGEQSVSIELQKSSDYTQADIKNAVGK